MELRLLRSPSGPYCTPGRLLVEGAFFCYTLEDVVREKKIPGQTAIPAGRYQVVLNFSNRFQKVMPLLLNVPGFEGVRIHSGNNAEDTEGCILVGFTRQEAAVGDSRRAYAALMKRLESAGSETWIEIVNEDE